MVSRYIITTLVIVCVLLGISLNNTLDKNNILEAEKLASKMKFDRDRKSYEDAIQSVSDYYESLQDDVTKFKEHKNETKCEAVNRLLNRYGN